MIALLFILGVACGVIAATAVIFALETKERERSAAGTITLDAENAAETLHLVAWMENYAPSALEGWRENYANWKRRQNA